MRITYRPALDWSEVDRKLGLPTDAQCRALAAARDREHIHQPPGPEADGKVPARLVGVFGERALARYLFVPMRTDVLGRRGDGRSNLVSQHGVTVDAVCRQPYGAQRDQMPELILLTGARERPELALALVVWLGHVWEPIMAGWLWEQELRDLARVKTFRNKPNFTATYRDLRPMKDLKTVSPWSPPPQQSSMFDMADADALPVGRTWIGKL